MEEEHLTVDQCDELAKALREDAARLPHGSQRENLLRLAEELPPPCRHEKDGSSQSAVADGETGHDADSSIR
jgi:hypothetical protein